MIILKFGGSLITDKKKETPTINEENLKRIGSILSKHSHEFIIVHGAGSFGHPIAKKFDLANGLNSNPNQRKAIEETRKQVLELNQILCSDLNKSGIQTKTIIPSQTMKTNGPKSIKEVPIELFDEGLETGKIPVTFGDVTEDNLQGICILSGDVIMEELVKHYKPKMSIFVMDYPGVFDRNPTDKDAHIISTVHDEIVVECAEDQVEDVKTLMERVMIEAGSKLLKKVPVEVDISIGPTLASKG